MMKIKPDQMLGSKIGFFVMMTLGTQAAFATLPQWQMVPEKSSITFTATQNDAPVKGEFKKFNADIQFDPAQLKDSHANITIDTSSINTSYQELAEALKMSEWFDVKTFPQASFKSKDFTKVGDNTYEAKGDITIRDKTIPASIKFTVENSTPSQLQTKGTTTLKRTAFGIGQGEWSDTKEVKDDVKVDFTLDLKQ